MSDRLSVRAWLSCLLTSGGESVDAPAERRRNECVLRATSLILPLVVWQVSSPLYKSKGLWENGRAVLPTSTTRGPEWQHRYVFSALQDSAGSFYVVSSRSTTVRLPTVYCSFMQGVSVDFVVVESHKHASVWMPAVPQHSCDGGREVGELKAGDCCLETTQSFFSLVSLQTYHFYIQFFYFLLFQQPRRQCECRFSVKEAQCVCVLTFAGENRKPPFLSSMKATHVPFGSGNTFLTPTEWL